MGPLEKGKGKQTFFKSNENEILYAKRFLAGQPKFPQLSISLFLYNFLQGMIALRREATELMHEDYMDGILEVQAKKKANLNYYA